MTIEKMGEVLALVKYPGYTFFLSERMFEDPYLIAVYYEEDVEAKGQPLVQQGLIEQRTRRWIIPKNCTPSELVQTALKCVMTSMEHRVREHFTYRDRAVFHPHPDVEALVSECDRQAQLRLEEMRRKERGQ